MNRAPTTATSSPGTLTHCPVCTYPVEGLAAQQRCPECGFELDREWLVFGGPTPHRLRVWWQRPGVVFLWLLFPMACMLLTLAMMQRVYLPLLGIALPGLLVLGLALRPPRRFMALGDDALRLYRGPRLVRELAWDRIEQVRYTFGMKFIELRLRDSDERIVLQHYLYFGMDPVRPADCARVLQQRVRASAPENASA